MNTIKKDLLHIFHTALDSVSGKRVVKKEISKQKYSSQYHVIAIGKAADAMVQGLSNNKVIDGLLISKHGHISEELQQDSRFICLESDHPIPQESSIRAGVALLDYIAKLPPDANCLFLISGGASALVEVLQDNWTLKNLTELSNFLLANAFPINEINAIRKKTSKIKGGGLWHYLGDRTVSCLMISDVPNDNPQDIGSGLLFPSENKLLIDLTEKLPKKWSSKIQSSLIINAPDDFDWKIIASLSTAKQAAANCAKTLGYSVKIIPDFLDGRASEAGTTCVSTVRNNPQILLIWGGETTVILPKNPGKGGRNQHLALSAAIQMNDLQNCYLLAAGTDGSDGLSIATGALVDSHTLKRGYELGLNANDFLQNADSNTFFSQTDELIITGGTGTNVMDLVFAIHK